MTTYDRLLNMILKRKNELKLRNEDLAKLVYVNKRTIGNYLNGKTSMPADVMFATLIAVGYKVEVVECSQKN